MGATSLDLGKVMEQVSTPKNEAEVIVPTVTSQPKVDTTSGKAPESTPKVEPKTDERVSSKLQTLVRREKQAIERERSAKTREEAAIAREQALSAREEKIKTFETLKETSPLKALELLGLSYADLTQIALSDGNVPPDLRVQKLDEKVENLQKTLKEDKEALATEEKNLAARREAQALDEFKGSISSYLDQNSEKYALIHFEGQKDLVFEVIDGHYNKTFDPKTGIGKIMSIEDAADKVEKALEKDTDEKYSKAPAKIKNKFLPQTPVKPVFQAERMTVQRPRTLTNQNSATPSRPRTQPITDEERIAKAIAYARGIGR